MIYISLTPAKAGVQGHVLRPLEHWLDHPPARVMTLSNLLARGKL